MRAYRIEAKAGYWTFHYFENTIEEASRAAQVLSGKWKGVSVAIYKGEELIFSSSQEEIL